ncbi:MAG: AAA family ATPase [Lachnospiraceae bacterium]|nr:AAA family ATPase [Lachnospiraceae bacterium]
MVIWLSGAYGVGKSTVAKILVKKLENAIIFDAEAVGNVVRDSYPDVPYGYIFEDYPLWADFCRQLIQDVHDNFGKNILVDMTLVRESSKKTIIDRLQMDGIDVYFFVLTASRGTIHERILARGENENCWCIENLDMAMEKSAALDGAIRIDTQGIFPDAIAEQICASLHL